MELTELVDIAIKASLEAGKIIIDIYNSTKFEIEFKGDNSPVTTADKLADNLINEILKETDLPILSEEGLKYSFQERKNWNQYWLVDPLDGTKEFIARNGDFTVNIALIESNKPIAGVIYSPVSAELYVGVKNNGSYKFLNPNADIIFSEIKKTGIKLPDSKSKSEKIIAISRSHFNSETEIFVNQLIKKYPNSKFISLGSSKKLAQIAEGKIDIHPRFGKTMEWDTAAGHAILLEVEKNIFETDIKTPLKYNKENLTNPNFIAL